MCPALYSLGHIFNHPQLCAQIRKIVPENVRLIFALEFDTSLLKAAKDLDAFQNGFKSTNDGLRNALFQFLESVLTNLALERASGDMLDLNIGKWAQNSSSMNAVTRRALNSTHFVRSVGKFIHEKIRVTNQQNRKNQKNSGSLVPDSSPNFVVVKNIY